MIVVFVVLFCCCVAVAIFPMMTQAADPTLAVKRVMKDRSCESEGNMLYLCWNMLFLKVCSIWLSFPVEWISLDMTCRLLDMLWNYSCFFVDGLENNTMVLVLLS